MLERKEDRLSVLFVYTLVLWLDFRFTIARLRADLRHVYIAISVQENLSLNLNSAEKVKNRAEISLSWGLFLLFDW